MIAHLIDSNGNTAAATVQAFPNQPRIVSRAGKEYANYDPGFVFFGGLGVGEYMEYSEATPHKV